MQPLCPPSIIAFLPANLPGTSWLWAATGLIVVPLSFLAFYHRDRLPLWVRRAWLVAIFALVAISCSGALRTVERNVRTIPDWDFRVFWIYGQLLAQHANVYEPATFQQFKIVFHPSADFIDDVLNVGATYPPPTMFLFLPLGWLDVHTGSFIWYLLQAACLFFSAHLLRKLFFPAATWGLVWATFLLFSLHPTLQTISLAQTNFLVLLLLLLYWRDRELPRAGIWLTLAVFVKPFAAALLADLFLRRRWRALIYVAASEAALWAASLALVGPQTFSTFFSSPPEGRVPYWVYTEPVNQSLLAVVLRSVAHRPGMGSPITQPVFVAFAILLTCITGGLAHRVRNGPQALGLSLTLALALLLYPGTLNHYAVVLLIPLLTVWASRDQLPGKTLSCAILTGAMYGLTGLSQGDAVFAAIFLIWIYLAVVILITGNTTLAHASGGSYLLKVSSPKEAADEA